MSELKCPKCGVVMREEFDYVKVASRSDLTLAKPTGRYSCLHCKTTEAMDAVSDVGEKE